MIKENTIYEYIQTRLESVSSRTEHMKKRFNEYALISTEVENPNAWKTHKAHLQEWEHYEGRLQALKDLEQQKTAYAIHCFISNRLHDSTDKVLSEFQKGALEELIRASYVLANLNVFEASEIHLIEQ